MRRSAVSRLVVFGLALAVLVVGPAPLAAQKKASDEPPPRPRLDPGRDTNSAADYYYHGVRVMRERPRDAAAAFYWAGRINPLWAEPLYGRRVAGYLTRVNGYGLYALARRSGKRSPEERALDSLQYQALLRNPFLYERLDQMVLRALLDKVEQATGELITMSQGSNDDPQYSAWMAYSEGRFPAALKWNATALKRYPREAQQLHAERGRIFFLIAQYDSAVAELGKSLEALRKQDAKKLVVLYESKAMYEYSIAQAHVQRGDLGAAREAYGRALTEDLSFYMAHAGLGDVAFAEHDTATALNEYELAVQLHPDDGGLLYRHASLLMSANKLEPAAEQLVKASIREPYFAAPRLDLARIYDAAGQGEEAAVLYREYLAVAAQSDPGVAFANERIKLLASAAGAQPAGAQPAGTQPAPAP